MKTALDSWKSHPGLPWLAAMLLGLVGLLISLTLAQQARQQHEQQLSRAIELAADSAKSNILTQLNTYSVVMFGLRGYFMGSEYIDFDEFAEYVNALRITEKLPGVQAINLVISIPDAERAERLEEIRQWLPDFDIEPPGERAFYAPIVRSQPLNAANRKALGLDVMTVPTAYHAMQRATDTGEIAISAPLSLVQDELSQDTPAFVMYLAIYDKSSEANTVEQRRQAVVAWVDVPFRMHQLIAGLRGELDPQIDLEIYDVSSNATPVLMFETDTTSYAERLNAGYLQRERLMDFGGRQWAVKVSATPAFEQRVSNRHWPWLVLLLSLLLSFSFSWLLWLLVKHRQQAEVRFRKLFEQTQDGVLLLNQQHQIIEANPAALDLLNCDKQRLLRSGLKPYLPEPLFEQQLPALQTGQLPELETQLTRADGSQLPVDLRSQQLDAQHYFVSLRDLRDSKQKQAQILRLSAAYRALSVTNQAIVHMDTVQQLLPLLCRTAVELGGMKMAWIGMLNPINQQVEVNCHYGSGSEYLQDLNISIRGDSEAGQGPTGTAMRENRAVIINDYANEPMTANWHERARSYGWASAAAFPITRAGQPFAALNVYHDEIGAFDQELIALFGEMVADISFAIDNCDRNQQREAAERALAASEATMSTILENVSACIYMKDNKGRYVYANKQVLDLWGTSHEHVIGHDDNQFFDWKTVAKIRANDRLVLDQGQTVTCEEVNTVAATGETVIFWSVKLPLVDDDGKVYGLCGISADITELKRAERAMQDSEARYRLIYAANPIPMWVYDLDTLRFLTVNDAAIHQYGFSRDEFLNMTIADLHPASVLPDLHLNLQQTRSAGVNYYNEAGVWPHRRKDGSEIWVEITAHTLNFEGHNAEIILAHNVTERMAAEATLKLNAQVFEASREGIVITDADFNVVSVNQAYQDITGYQRQAILGSRPDIFSKDFQNEELQAFILQQLETDGYWVGELEHRRNSGDAFPLWLSISLTRDEQGQISNYIVIMTDLSERKAAEAQIQFLSNFDPLTHLPNMSMLRDRADHMLGQMDENQSSASLLCVDLDRFKFVNDSLGPTAGDSLLKILSTRIVDVVSKSAMVCRQGGDEFLLLLPDCDSEKAAHIAQKLLEKVAQPVTINEQSLTLTASIGIAQYPQDGHDFEKLMQAADAALFRAKQQGRKTFQFFTKQMQQQAQFTLQIENELRVAIEQEQLLLHYQPQVDIDSGVITGLEALIRWHHPERGMVSPADFIPLAEESGLITDIGDWVLNEVARQLSVWQQNAQWVLPVAVNLSVEQFRQGMVYQQVSDVLRRYKLDPGLLELELTESIAMENTAKTIQIVEQLHRLGVSLSLDDFGTGYSSLSYLKRFPLHTIKIDQSFVRDIGRNPEDEAIIEAIISLSKSLGFSTIAEGVETAEQLQFLRQHACDRVQGYYFSKPLPANELAQLMEHSKGVLLK